MPIEPINVVALVQAIFTGIAAVGGVFATIYALVAASRAKRAEQATTESTAALALIHKEVIETKDNIKIVEKATNSMMEARLKEKDALLVLSVEKSKAEGALEGVATEKAKQAERAIGKEAAKSDMSKTDK